VIFGPVENQGTLFLAVLQYNWPPLVVQVRIRGPLSPDFLCSAVTVTQWGRLLLRQGLPAIAIVWNLIIQCDQRSLQR